VQVVQHDEAVDVQAVGDDFLLLLGCFRENRIGCGERELEGKVRTKAFLRPADSPLL
jgi:hypothetical protein